MEELKRRYHSKPPEEATAEEQVKFEASRRIIRENIFYLIKEWCKWYYHDFAVSDSLRQQLSVFVNEIIGDLAQMDEVIRVQCAELPKLISHMVRLLLLRCRLLLHHVHHLFQFAFFPEWAL